MASARLRRVCAALLIGLAANAHADEIGDALSASQQSLKGARESQQRIDKLDDEARRLREKRLGIEWQAQQLSAYALDLDELAAEEERNRAELEEQIGRIRETASGLLPLMQRMVSALETFVGSDLPFLQEQRRERIDALKAVLEDPARTPSEKYRRVLDAYRSEVDYGHSVGTEEGQIVLDGQTLQASLVRVGRVGLYALAGPQRQPAFWNRERSRWEALDEDLAENVQSALAVARGAGPAELLVLPVAVPQAQP